MQTALPISPGAIDAAGILAPLVAPVAARARAFMDTNRVSATYGCADRPYWYYRTLTNFSGSTWQQVMLGLAALYKTQHAGNPHVGDPGTLEAASAALSYWCRIAHRDGAFDEWYLNEFSYCPTAITGAGVALTLDLIGDELQADVRKSAAEALCRTASWLDKRYNPTVMNQNLAAAVALAGAARIDSRWRTAAETKLSRVHGDQSPEGWFPEYAGADLGYSTLALDLLAAYDRLSGAGEAREMAASLTKFLVEVQGGWRALGGRVGSRGTSHVFPFGALHFAKQDKNAEQLAASWLAGLSEGAAPTPGIIDDRYFAYFYFPEFALAYEQAARGGPLQLAHVDEQPGILDQRASGLVAIRRAGWASLVSRRLGGALALNGRNRAPLYHLGYEIETRGGRFSSANWDEEFACTAVDDAVIYAQSEFRASSAGIPLKTLMAPFRLVVGFLGTSGLAEGFQGIIKKKMIAPKRAPGLRLERKIVATESGLDVHDQLVSQPGLVAIKRLDIARTISMHSPSARQDSARNVELPEAMLNAAAADLNAGKRVALAFSLDGATGTVSLGQGS
jgi:hypothetical protein